MLFLVIKLITLEKWIQESHECRKESRLAFHHFVDSNNSTSKRSKMLIEQETNE